MENLEIIDYDKFDINKKTIVVFSLEQAIDKNMYDVTTKYFYNTANILNKDFNILLVTRNLGLQWIDIARNDERTKNFIYLDFDSKNRNYKKRSSANMSKEEIRNYIIGSIVELEQQYPDLCKSFIGTINTNNTIPGLNLNSEIISNGDERLLKKQITASEKYKRALKEYKIISYKSFLYKPYAFGYTFLGYLMENYPNVYHYNFAHATSSLWVIYTKKYNPFTNKLKCFYHIDQNIENREFVKFPIVQIHDCYKNKEGINSINDYESILNSKEIDFLFGGLFPSNISSRENAWYKYFNNLNGENIKIRTQISNSWKVKNKSFSKEITNKDNKLSIDIKNHNNIYSVLEYDEYNKELKKSMFTLLLECYPGKYDHFTLRFISSLFFGCLPLISEEYDVNNLQIPIEFRSKLLVKNDQDIMDKINYYKNNYDEYKKLFYDMWNYYINENHFKREFYENEFKNNLFKEIY